MEANRSLIEELRHRLSRLESSQRASGSTADPGFLARAFASGATTSLDAAEPASETTPRPDAAESGSRPSPGPGAARSGDEGDGRGKRPPSTGSTGFTGVTGFTGFTGFGDQAGLAAGVAAAMDAGFGPTRPRPAQVPEGDLFEVVGGLGGLNAARERLLVSVVAELDSRALDSPGGLSRIDWLRSQDPTLSAGQAKAIVTVAKAFAEPRWEALKDAVVGESKHASAGWTTVGNAAQVVEFHERLRKVADPDELDEATTHLTEQAKRLRGEELAKLARLLGDQVRPPKDTDDQDRRCRNSRGLWWGQPNATGMVHLKGVFDPEGAAILKSAIDPLAAPRPLTGDCGDTIETDERSPEQRRADALIELVQRAVSAPDGAPSTDKAKIVVTFDYDTLAQTLADAVREWNARTTGSAGAGFADGRAAGQPTGAAGTTGDSRFQRPVRNGQCMSGDVLSPQTVRRLACDAAIIPVVLGSNGQPLDVGREERLVTRAMRTALWLRDRGCTFPGCSIPAQWTEAHHVIHWLNGGTTAISNLALLCQRHHTHVHDKNLTATINGDGAGAANGTAVTWHTWHQWKTGRPPPGGLHDRPANPPSNSGSAPEPDPSCPCPSSTPAECPA